QTDIQAGSADIGHRVVFHQLVKPRRFCRTNGITVIRRIIAKPVHNAQYNRFFHKTHLIFDYLEAAATIFAKSGAFKEAPPIRPPSTFSLETSSSALPAFMEPPY